MFPPECENGLAAGGSHHAQCQMIPVSWRGCGPRPAMFGVPNLALRLYTRQTRHPVTTCPVFDQVPSAPAAAAPQGRPESHKSSHVPVPVPVYCRPLMEKEQGMKVRTAGVEGGLDRRATSHPTCQYRCPSTAGPSWRKSRA